MHVLACDKCWKWSISAALLCILKGWVGACFLPNGRKLKVWSNRSLASAQLPRPVAPRDKSSWSLTCRALACSHVQYDMPACMHAQSQIHTRGRGWKGSCLWLKCYHPHLCRALPCQEHMLHQIPSVCSVLRVAISTKAPLALIFQLSSLWNCASSSLCLNVFNQLLWDFGEFFSLQFSRCRLQHFGFFPST